MSNLTYKEWKAKGFHVIKGQKATGRNKEGVATFTDKQVTINWVGDGADYEYEGSWEDMLGDPYWYK